MTAPASVEGVQGWLWCTVQRDGTTDFTGQQDLLDQWLQLVIGQQRVNASLVRQLCGLPALAALPYLAVTPGATRRTFIHKAAKWAYQAHSQTNHGGGCWSVIRAMESMQSDDGSSRLSSQPRYPTPCK